MQRQSSFGENEYEEEETGPFSQKEKDEQLEISKKMSQAQNQAINANLLANLSVEELKSMLEQKKSNYDLSRKNFGNLSKKIESLQEMEAKIQKGYEDQLTKIEKSQIQTQYTKSLLVLKCNFLKIQKQQQCNNAIRLQDAFTKFKLFTQKRSLEANYVAHKLQIALNQSVSKNILNRFKTYSKENCKRMFTKWKQICQSENGLLDLNAQMKNQIKSMKQQLEKNNTDIAKYQAMKQKMSLAKKDAGELAQDYAEKIKKQRQGAPDKKEMVKQRLIDQFNQQKRQNKQLKEKLEQTEMCVQQFISEMGYLIDQGEQQPAVANSTRVTAGGTTLTAGRNVPQNRTHYAGGGSGESTGGSASIF